jgi:IS5 family transposase
VLQSLHNLSDEQTEYLIRDRLSFMRFLDLELEIWLFREALAEAGLIDQLFERFGQHLEAEGYIARGGQIIDADCVGAQAAQHEGGEPGDQGRPDAGGMGGPPRMPRRTRTRAGRRGTTKASTATRTMSAWTRRTS